MKIKNIIITIIISFCFIINVHAKNYVVTKGKDYVATAFSYNRVKIVNLIENTDLYLEGSLFEITKEDGEVFASFTSFNDTAIIEGMEEGKYYLVQKDVPKGYKLNTEKIEFTVESSPVDLKVVNLKESVLPGEIDSSTALIIFIGMVDISIGIVMLIYVKKSKNKR